MATKTVADLATVVSGEVVGDPVVAVSDATHDSRHAGPETLFIAVRGARHDGHAFVEDAVRAGSPAVCVSEDLATTATRIIVSDTRAAMGPLSARIHDDPSIAVPVIGVTGTNGKTTVTHFAEAILRAAGRNPGLIGTVGSRVGGRVFPTVRTTPEATDFQRLLAEMRDAGADVIATEVSSHALELGRVAGTHFTVAAFTNLSQDHLDFHGDMERYGAAKRRLFTEYDIGTAVINLDDPYGRSLAEATSAPVTTVGRGGDLEATDIAYSAASTTFTLTIGGDSHQVTVPILGEFNVANVVVAAGCCLAVGVDAGAVVDGMAALRGVPGRFELVSTGSRLRVFVDYAHTPDSIAAAIAAARAMGPRRVIALIGAGGDRDAAKRPEMGRAASAADVVVVTSDNPRSEDPEVIAGAVESGLAQDVARLIDLDRRSAIEKAIAMASPDDIVLLLGKGHETDQEIAGRVLPFDDRAVAGQILDDAESHGPSPDSGSMYR
jgi:UDP-N-acetylmuramoyl-L-alanyl-D-glutamate--2,6-diaminopimelate ligase